ncbi:peptidylprolyl isomerase [Geotalea sp. SG265]|uniref:FKBP-type peptidyl-prolyl cis-trans isomerase n=1 Tax=Geotalea sp. SG265 TaxID=2922867 RepID=UPI001FAF25D2|nr:peptidylprolyl isomerase [Geotalea sp. SG265]
MAQAKKGDRVKVHYTGKLDDGSVFDSSECGDSDCDCSAPLQFTVGAGEVIPGFDQAVEGMAINETRSVHIPVAEAYGERIEEMVAQVPRSELPADMVPEVGQQLEVTQEDGNAFQVVITEVTDNQVTIDANHPLAGRDLNFDIRLVEIG